jgi:tetratricopeptide (TPR) repeat protein
MKQCAAIPKLPSDPRWEPYRRRLRVRELFCRARTNPSGALNLLLEADAASEFRIPEVADALGIYWMQSTQADRLTRAEAYFKRARDASPDWLYPRHNLALLYSERGDMRAAEREYREAFAHSHVHPYIYYNYGLILERLNRLRDAAAEYRKSLGAYDDAIALLNARSAEWARDYTDQSRLASQRAGVFLSAKAEVFNAWGSLLEAKRDLKGARDRYLDAHKLDAALCPPVFNLARMNLVLASNSADRETAAGELRQNLPACASFAPAHLLLANIYFRQYRQDGQQLRIDAAGKEFEEAGRLMPLSVPALLGASAVADLQGRFETALEWLDKAVSHLGEERRSFGPIQEQVTPTNPALYTALAERYQKAGSLGACRQTYALAELATAGQKEARGKLPRIADRCRADATVK